MDSDVVVRVDGWPVFKDPLPRLPPLPPRQCFNEVEDWCLFWLLPNLELVVDLCAGSWS